MAMMKVSDYIMQFLVDHGIRDLFLVPGGGMMHLLDAAQRQEGLNLIFNLNEQASGICAESYAQFTGKLGACMVTTGPGATNAVTGCAGAWLDSTPAVFISGQCKTQQMGQLKGLRIYGAQEVAIVPCVKPITKYAVTILDKEKIQYHLQKAVYLATHGRKGPVWLDVPLDIQGDLVDIETLETYDPLVEKDILRAEVGRGDICEVYRLINKASRPVVFVGHGAVAAGCQEKLRALVKKLCIPVLVTWRAKDIFGDDEPLFMGSPGTVAPRYANYVLQNADFLLVIGSRLNATLTAYDEAHFAPMAKKVIVDIEQAEMDKLDMEFALKLALDAGDFVDAMLEQKEEYATVDRSRWLEFCACMKQRYPIVKEEQPFDNGGRTDGYQFADKLSDYASADDVFVGSSSGRTCGISHLAFRLKKGQRFITSMGLGSMGWCLPSAIACCIASGRKRTLLLEGDGSLQHNIQELRLITTYRLPIKLFVFSNQGYASIYTMQRNNFKSRFAGCTVQSGLAFANIQETARLYGLAYFCIHSDDEIDLVLERVMKDDRPCLCEVEGSIQFDEIPKSVTTVNEDGTFSSCSLENLYPFVSVQEQRENMPNWYG